MREVILSAIAGVVVSIGYNALLLWRRGAVVDRDFSDLKSRFDAHEAHNQCTTDKLHERLDAIQAEAALTNRALARIEGALSVRNN